LIYRNIHSFLFVAPLIAGAYASGLFYLAEQSVIPITLFQLALAGSIGGFILLKFLNVDSSFELYGMEKWYALFLGLIFLSCVYTPERQQAVFYAIRFSVLLGMTYFIYNIIQKTQHLKIGVYAFIGSGVIVALINLYQIYANPEILAFNYLKQGVRIIRSTGAENDPNMFASNFFTPILICVAWMGTTINRWFRLVLFGFAGVMLASVLLTYSRSAWISLFVGILTIQLYQRKNPILIYCAIALFVVFLISPTVQNLILSLWDRIVGLFVGGGDDSTKFRVVLAMGALTMIADSYLLGVGFQGFSTYFQYLYPPQETQWIFEPHNDFYMVFAELGLLGFLLFVLIMYLIFRQALESMQWFRSIHENHWIQAVGLGFLASFVSYIIFAQFISGLMLNSLFMILVALIFSLSKFTDQSRI
tara:strand:+ start:11190 stop:12446 length:1257 start_codon:yes stop_codon:yes gene_type:complete